ncbi:hypothetical protein Tco_1503091 [Tanacetum coccineum]
MKGGGLSFPDFLLVRYGINQGDGLVWNNRYAQWCSENSIPGASTSISIPTQENNKLRPRDYSFKEWGDNTNWWHDHGFEEDERQESGLDIEEYDPPEVHVETFEVKRHSFDSGHSFICVTKEIEDTLPGGRENGSRKNTSIGTRDAGFGRGKQAEQESQGQLRLSTSGSLLDLTDASIRNKSLSVIKRSNQASSASVLYGSTDS